MTRSLKVLPKEIPELPREWTEEAVAAFIAAVVRASEGIQQE